MEPQKQKQKKNHVVILTSNAADANVKQFRFRPWVMWLVLIVICILLGAVLGYFMYEDRIWERANKKIAEYEGNISELQKVLEEKEAQAAEEKKQMELELEKLEKDSDILKETVNLIREEKEQLEIQMQALYNPTMLPLTGGATIEEMNEGDPMCLFNATEGALVVATASGVVTEIIEEPEYGYKVTIDHENGYVTIYRNKEIPKVKQGEKVMQGITIFVIGEDNLKLGYQVQKEGAYIDPMDIMDIEG